MQRFPIICLSFILLVGIIVSCDQLQQDVVPTDPVDPDFEVKTLPESPLVVNLLERHSVGATTTFNLKSATTNKGRAEFVDKGLVLYTPNAGENSGTDEIDYEVCADGNCQDFAIGVTFTTDSTDVPCEQGVRPDFITIFCPAPEENIFIDVLANDYFCDQAADPQTLALISEPIYGTARVEDGQVIYNQSPVDSVNILPFPWVDVLVYRVAQTGDPSNVGYAAVVITILPDVPICTDIAAQDDFVTVNQDEDSFIDVLQNDILCIDQLETIIIDNQPTNGVAEVLQASIDFLPSIKYTPNAGYVGSDQLTYTVRNFDGLTATATVYLEVIADSGFACTTVLPTAQEDSLIIPISQIVGQEPVDTTVFTVAVLQNDDFCPGYITSGVDFSILEGPIMGSAWINEDLIYYVPPTGVQSGDSDVIQYQICGLDGNCATTLLRIIFVP
ncbi:MAG: Ig-like domain-containing protein [Bacteroidota bacterium]